MDSFLGLILTLGIDQAVEQVTCSPCLQFSRGSLVIHSHCLVQCVTQNWSNKMPFNGANHHFWTELRAPTLFNVTGKFRFLTYRLISHWCVRRNQEHILRLDRISSNHRVVPLHICLTLEAAFDTDLENSFEQYQLSTSPWLIWLLLAVRPLAVILEVAMTHYHRNLGIQST